MAGPGKPVRKTVPADPGERVPEAMLEALAVRVPPFIQDWTGALWPAMSAILAKRLIRTYADIKAATRGQVALAAGPPQVLRDFSAIPVASATTVLAAGRVTPHPTAASGTPAPVRPDATAPRVTDAAGAGEP